MTAVGTPGPRSRSAAPTASGPAGGVRPTTYVTVAIPYVNADPHLGYAYELVAADVYARSRRAAGDQVRFLGGTDDYSLKNVLAADAAGVPTAAFVDAHAERFQALAGPLDLSFDDFIRTSSDPRHRPAVERLWRACAAKGDLYRRDYEGDYCVGCEQFYEVDEAISLEPPASSPMTHRITGSAADTPATTNRLSCPEHRTPLERVAEPNWFFRLSAYQDHVEQLITSGQLEIHPSQYRDEVLAFVRGGLRDISVSRSAVRARSRRMLIASDFVSERAPASERPDSAQAVHGVAGERDWGIPVPGDPGQVIYVWFDALTNYISALGFGDPESGAYRRWWLDADRRVHVIGKGIVRFHAVFWPAFLASAGQPAPTRIEVHPYLTVDGAKLSKSSGITIGPERIVDTFGTDALRWWFARDVSNTADTDFTASRVVGRANDDLANGVGNLTNRLVTLVGRYRDGRVADADALPIDGVIDVEADVADALAEFDLRTATRLLRDAVDALNRDLELTRPWELARVPAAAPNLDRVLSRQLAGARAIARALRPIVPALAARLAAQLGHDGQVASNARPGFARLDDPGPSPLPDRAAPA